MFTICKFQGYFWMPTVIRFVNSNMIRNNNLLIVYSNYLTVIIRLLCCRVTDGCKTFT